jgi:PAS domain S-box-containing protein
MSERPRRLEADSVPTLAFAGALISMALGSLVLVGWVSGLYAQSVFVPGGLPMKANAALLLVLSGSALAIHVTSQRPRLVRVLALVVISVASATALEYATGIDLGIDQLLASDVVAPGAPYAGRMAIGAVVAFGAGGLALLMLGRTWQGWHPTLLGALVVAVIGWLGVLGYAYGADEITSIGSQTRIALPAAIGFVVMAASLIAADPRHGPMLLLRDPGLAGQVARRILPTAALVVPLSGWLRIELTQAGVFDERAGTAFRVILEVLVIGLVGFWTTSRVWRLERERAEAQRERDRVLETTEDLICATDADGRLTLVSPSWTRHLGYEPKELLGHTIAEFLHADDLEPASEAFRAGDGRMGEGIGHVNRVRARDGTHRWVEWNSSGDPETGQIYASGRDVTEHHRAELEMRRLAMAIEQSGDAVFITDASGRIEYVNPAFEQVSGYARDEVLGQNPRILKSGAQGPAFYAAMWAALSRGDPFVGDLTNRHKDGTLFQEEAVISPVRDQYNRITSYVAVERNVTLQRALEAAAARTTRERALIAATLADLHPLATPAETAEAICRQVANLAAVASASVAYFTPEGPAAMLAFARTDGVGVPLKRLPSQRSKALRERAEAGPWVEAWVRRPSHPYAWLHTALGTEALAYAPVRHAGGVIGLLTVASPDVDAVERLTESLPALLEFAGFAGVLLGPAIASMTRVGTVRERIAQIIKTAAFRPVFQPIVDLATGERLGYEALTRFTSATAPDIVFADARAAGLESELELATLAAAISSAAGLPHGAWLSLNVSPTLVTGDDRLATLLRRSDRPLVLEVTEHIHVDDYVDFREAIDRLRPGVRVAVDDAGAGVANFSHIIELRPAFVKVDIGLVRGIDTDLSRQALMVGLLHFADKSASQTIAEGLETDAELAMLRELGVPLAQGYLLGRPAPVADWAGALERRPYPGTDVTR